MPLLPKTRLDIQLTYVCKQDGELVTLSGKIFHPSISNIIASLRTQLKDMVQKVKNATTLQNAYYHNFIAYNGERYFYISPTSRELKAVEKFEELVKDYYDSFEIIIIQNVSGRIYDSDKSEPFNKTNSSISILDEFGADEEDSDYTDKEINEDEEWEREEIEAMGLSYGDL